MDTDALDINLTQDDVQNMDPNMIMGLFEKLREGRAVMRLERDALKDTIGLGLNNIERLKGVLAAQKERMHKVEAESRAVHTLHADALEALAVQQRTTEDLAALVNARNDALARILIKKMIKKGDL